MTDPAGAVSEERLRELRKVLTTRRNRVRVLEARDMVAVIDERLFLRHQLAELQRDASRYRWLRSREWAVYALEYGCPDGIEYRDQPEDTLDATIDAQLAEVRT